MTELYEAAANLRIVMYGVVAPAAFVLSLSFWQKRQKALSMLFLFLTFIVLFQQYGLILTQRGDTNRQAVLVNTMFWLGLTVSIVTAALRYVWLWLRAVCEECVDRLSSMQIRDW